MAEFEADLQTMLGTLVSGRCYPLINTSGNDTKPYITFEVVAESPLTVTAGTKKRRRVEVDVFGETYGSAKAVGDSVEAAFDSSSFASAQIQRIDLYEEQSREYRQLLEFYIWY